jgi:hypothetical protein
LLHRALKVRGEFCEKGQEISMAPHCTFVGGGSNDRRG